MPWWMGAVLTLAALGLWLFTIMAIEINRDILFKIEKKLCSGPSEAQQADTILRLQEKLQLTRYPLECPRCEAENFIEPSSEYGDFTCHACGHYVDWEAELEVKIISEDD